MKKIWKWVAVSVAAVVLLAFHAVHFYNTDAVVKDIDTLHRHLHEVDHSRAPRRLSEAQDDYVFDVYDIYHMARWEFAE